ncbi:MAG TPA: MoaD/ThiS family protein [Chthoniobacterales bacterium]|nr:MoaD/ThiS family protein [Chthoniobacterales bacterium]
MNVAVQFYAQLRDLAGISELDIEVPSGATVNDLLQAVYQHAPALRAQDKSILIGSGVEFVDRGHTLTAGETISIMPPVQGG